VERSSYRLETLHVAVKALNHGIFISLLKLQLERYGDNSIQVELCCNKILQLLMEVLANVDIASSWNTVACNCPVLSLMHYIMFTV